jgi:hypothetical protein
MTEMSAQAARRILLAPMRQNRNGGAVREPGVMRSPSTSGVAPRAHRLRWNARAADVLETRAVREFVSGWAAEF